MKTPRLFSPLRRRLPRPVEARSRALVKTVLYRGLMVAITVAIAFVVTGSAGDALQIGFVTNLLKTGTYYGYERLWARISWGVAAD